MRVLTLIDVCDTNVCFDLPVVILSQMSISIWSPNNNWFEWSLRHRQSIDRQTACSRHQLANQMAYPFFRYHYLYHHSSPFVWFPITSVFNTERHMWATEATLHNITQIWWYFQSQLLFVILKIDPFISTPPPPPPPPQPPPHQSDTSSVLLCLYSIVMVDNVINGGFAFTILSVGNLKLLVSNEDGLSVCLFLSPCVCVCVCVSVCWG